LPLAINVKPYVLKGALGGDNYLAHYNATDSSGETMIISEFYPAYMVKREEDGTLGISERFGKEYATDLAEFVRRAEVFRDARETCLHPVVEIFERNNTAYIVRRACGLTEIDKFMGSATMDFDEAFFFIRPLLLNMAVLANKGLLFNISYSDFRVNSGKHLVLSAPPAWEGNFHASLIQVIKLYYRLITGVNPPEQGVTAPSAYGIELPPRIEDTVMEILAGDILFGSLDNFYKTFKSMVEGTQDTGDGKEKKTLSSLRTVAATLFVLFCFSLPVVALLAVRAHRESTFWANPEIFADAATADAPVHDFSAVTITHPRNAADALPGSIALHDGFVFFRNEGGMYSRRFGDVAFIPGAVGMAAAAEGRLIVPDAVPAFITGHGRYIYFTDAASGGAIFRTTSTGGNVEQITSYPALNLAVVDDYLFYTSPGNNHSLERITLTTNERRRIADGPVHAVHSYGSHLFFIEETTQGNALYSWDLAENRRVRLSTDATHSLRTSHDPRTGAGLLYYLNSSGRIRRIDFNGGSAVTFAPQNVSTFDVFFEWLVFAEENRHAPRAYNRNTGETITLSSDEWVSYVRAGGRFVYGIDHTNPTRLLQFDLP